VKTLIGVRVIAFVQYHCVNENYKEQITCKWDAVTSVLTNKAFGKHKIPYTQVDGGVVPTLKHKFFETDLPFGLCTFVDIARMIGVETPLIDAMIRWNQVCSVGYMCWHACVLLLRVHPRYACHDRRNLSAKSTSQPRARSTAPTPVNACCLQRLD
jgi:hypothetical protein